MLPKIIQPIKGQCEDDTRNHGMHHNCTSLQMTWRLTLGHVMHLECFWFFNYNQIYKLWVRFNLIEACRVYFIRLNRVYMGMACYERPISLRVHGTYIMHNLTYTAPDLCDLCNTLWLADQYCITTLRHMANTFTKRMQAFQWIPRGRYISYT